MGSEAIKLKHEEIKSVWETLISKAKEHRQKLDESYFLHRFLSDFRDLTSWINDNKSEIDAREDSFRATAEAGQMLLDSGHYASEEVKEKLVILAEEKTTLLQLWEERRILYEQCMDLHLFYRDAEQADTWMAKQEAFLDNQDLGDSLDSVE